MERELEEVDDKHKIESEALDVTKRSNFTTMQFIVVT